MKSYVCLALAAAGLGTVCLAGSHDDRWPVGEQETIEKTMTLAGEPMRLVVDNVDGHVYVRSRDGSQVHVSAHKIIHAETDSDLREAKNDVKLDFTERPGNVSVYYDAPWRCNGEGRGCHGDLRHFYNVTYNIDVEVPPAARIVVSTVNSGDVRVNGVSGHFDISNVNGGISMDGIGGSGDAHTVNGPVAVHFVKNPLSATSFKSINGQLDAYFQPGLSADLLFKTFNGEIFSDFDVAPGVLPKTVAEQHNGKYVYRSNRAAAGRAGNGGPEILFDAFNGNIRLHKEH